MRDRCPQCGGPLELGAPWAVDLRAELERASEPRRSWHEQLREKRVPLPTATIVSLAVYAVAELVRVILQR